MIVADVEIAPDGSPLWEDGHRWAIYAEWPVGERTLLYAAFVPNGYVETVVLVPDTEGRRQVWVREDTPHQVRVMEVTYAAPGQARSSSKAHYQIDRRLLDARHPRY